MIIKLTTAFVVTAALLCGTAQADFLQCSKTSDKANIIGVDAWSTSDLGDVDRHAGMDVPYADIVLTQEYHSNTNEALHHITMSHAGTDCRKVDGRKGYLCNEKYVDEGAGNTCAQVFHKSHLLGMTHGKAVDISVFDSDEPVHINLVLDPSLLTWSGGVPRTCATSRFSAPEKPMKTITFRASSLHKWEQVTVSLDKPDVDFGKLWTCGSDQYRESPRPESQMLDDGKTWIFYDVSFQLVSDKAAGSK